MKKPIKTYGNTLVIQFTKEEQKLYGIKAGQIYDIEIVLVKQEKRK